MEMNKELELRQKGTGKPN